MILPGSTAAVKGDEGAGVYAASKAAVRSFARTWANELKHRRIRVNAIAPGPIETPSVRGAFSDPQQPEQFKEFFSALVPLGRMGSTDEIADAVLFLASSRSSFVTGSNLNVDGGFTQI
ncbi:SDR family NAD(P)-dependent oxidoreductase [Amycolatopsis carbonis]|uniref:SDR family NAD(P)-dependent oxidoreductase n=1 Tax=Amycolatopsis carbonis TaxID=715471 RepID=UPI00334200F5